MNLATTMDSLATALGNITNLRCYGWPNFGAAVPCGIVGYPDSIEYDLTYQTTPGISTKDHAIFKLWVVAGSAEERSARDLLSPYVSSNGAKNIKQAIESHVGMTCRVTDCKIIRITMAGVEYLASEFEVEVWA